MNVKKNNTVSKKIAENVTYIAAVKGTTIYAAEQGIGKARGYFSRIKSGNGIISADDYYKLAEFFMIDRDDLTSEDYKILYKKMMDERRFKGRTHWVVADDEAFWTCSKCRETYLAAYASEYKFCPHCGSKMGVPSETVTE